MRRLFGIALILPIFLTIFLLPAVAERRLALVVGIQNYQHIPPLRNTIADAELVAEKLRAAGFDVDTQRDLSKDGLNRAVRDFSRKVEAANGDAIALVYYAGHGVQDDKQANYLIAADADVRSQVDLPLEALPLATVLRTVEGARPRITFAIIDACRDNPLPAVSTRGDKRGLAPETNLPRGLLIAYSTEPGKVAEDGPPGGHSPFARALADELAKQGLEATQLFVQVSRKVLDATKGAQFPWVTARLTESFFFSPGTPSIAPPPPLAPEPSQPTPSYEVSGEIDYGRAVSENSPEAYEGWLRKYPGHPLEPNVRRLLRHLQDERMWKRIEVAASSADQISQLEIYLVAFPDGVYAEKAKDKLQQLKSAPLPSSALQPGSFEPSPKSPGQISSSAVQRYPDLDAPGNDLGHWLEDVGESDCERACQSDRQCVAYTYNTRHSACFLKSRVAQLTEASGSAVTAILTDRAMAPSVAQVRRYSDRDAPGNDRGRWLRNVTSVDDCERACLADSGCAGYTYNIRRSVCIPKNWIAQLTTAPEPAVTGVVTGRAAAPVIAGSPAPTVRRYPGMDAPGHDRGSWRRGITTQECEDICLSDGGCVGYTYNKRRSTCILKDFVGQLSRAAEPAVTGVVEGRN